MSNYYTLLTQIGAAEFINAQAAGITVPFTHLALGDGNGAAIIPTEAMKTLVREVHRVPISSITADVANPNWLVVEAVLPTSIGGWTIREVGLIGGASAKLLAVGNFPDTYKPLLAEGSARDVVVRMIIQVGNASVVQLTVDPSVALATNQSIANAITAHKAELDPHPQYLTPLEGDQRYLLTGGLPLASATVQGLVELATPAETVAGTDAVRAVTPAGVQAKLVEVVQKNSFCYGADIGSANAYLVAYSPAIATLTNGMVLSFEAKVSNTGPSNFNVSGYGNNPILGGAHQPLQGGEIVAGGKVELMYHATLVSWVLLSCTAGAVQVGPAVKSRHAITVDQLQTNAPRYAVDTGAANVYRAAYTPAITALTDGMTLTFKAKTANTGNSTFVPDAVAAKLIYGAAHQQLQGGEILANSDVELIYNASVGAWILLSCTGGALQVGTATKSLQAVPLAQAQQIAADATKKQRALRMYLATGM